MQTAAIQSRECAQDLRRPAAGHSECARTRVCVSGKGCLVLCARVLTMRVRGRAEQKPPDFTRAGDSSANHIFSPDKRKVSLTPSTFQCSHGHLSRSRLSPFNASDESLDDQMVSAGWVLGPARGPCT